MEHLRGKQVYIVIEIYIYIYIYIGKRRHRPKSGLAVHDRLSVDGTRWQARQRHVVIVIHVVAIFANVTRRRSVRGRVHRARRRVGRALDAAKAADARWTRSLHALQVKGSLISSDLLVIIRPPAAEILTCIPWYGVFGCCCCGDCGIPDWLCCGCCWWPSVAWKLVFSGTLALSSSSDVL